MALAIDSQMPGGTGASGTSVGSLSYSFTNTAGTLLVTGVVLGSSGITLSGVTYNAIAETLAGSQIGHDGVTGALADLHYLLSPATGANTVAITASANCDIISGCISFTGNDTSTPIVQTAGNHNTTGTLSSVTVNGTVAGNYVVGCVTNGSAITGVHTGDGTQTWLLNINGNTFGNNGASAYIAGGGSVTIGFDQTSDGWGIIAAEIAVSSTGPTLALAGTWRPVGPSLRI